MIFELAFGIGATIILIAFVSEYVDSTLGMGYGTTLTPVLLLMGFEPLQIVPIVLVSEAITGATAAATHFKIGNVNFNLNDRPIRIAAILSACSIVGTVVAVFLAVSIPTFYIKLYIGVLVLVMGLFILLKRPNKDGFAWKKIVGLGLLASFNKGVSGGGYGPVVTSGQILSGVDEKSSIGITSFRRKPYLCSRHISIFHYRQRNGLGAFALPGDRRSAVGSVFGIFGEGNNNKKLKVYDSNFNNITWPVLPREDTFSGYSDPDLD